MIGRSVARFVALFDARGPRAVAACVLAVALWRVFVAGFVAGLSVAPQAAPPPPPVTLDARLVEIAPPPAPPLPPSRPALAPRTVAHAPVPAHTTSVPRVTVPQPAAPIAAPARTVVPESPAATVPPAAAATRAVTDESTAASAPRASAATGPDTSSHAAAHALLQPLPVIPDDLRDEGYRAVALARFTIHADGSVDVALVRPTQNPRLNQLLLETLRKWRFFPAMQAGRPVESEQDIRVHFNVE